MFQWFRNRSQHHFFTGAIAPQPRRCLMEKARPHALTAKAVGTAKLCLEDEEGTKFHLRKGEGDVTMVESFVSVFNEEIKDTKAENSPKHGQKPQMRRVYLGIRNGEVLDFIGRKNFREDKRTGDPYTAYISNAGGGQLARLEVEQIDNPELILAAAEKWED
jgi:hypothetical protein